MKEASEIFDESLKETWRKTHAPCRICDKQAVGCLSPDLDIVGLCYCKEHQIDVMQEYMMIIQEAREKYTPE
jgi:hypothetical protein